jgi:hemolysin activation/secretion protein
MRLGWLLGTANILALLSPAQQSVLAQPAPEAAPSDLYRWNGSAWAATETPPLGQAPEVIEKPQDTAIILSPLRGIVLLSHEADVDPKGREAGGFQSGDHPLLDSDDFREHIAPFIGRPASMATLHEISRLIVTYYRDHDRPLVDVAIPAGQDITNGVVQLVVTEFRIEKIAVQGAKWFSDDILLGQVRSKPGDIVSGARLQKDVNWLNGNPFRRVELVYTKSDAPGMSDITLRTEDKFPLRATASYDNTGAPATTRDRWNIGFTWGNALFLDHLLTYQLSTSDDFWHNRSKEQGDPHFVGHTVSYVIPLPWQDRLTISGNYSQSLPISGDPNFSSLGISAGANLQYGIPMSWAGGLTGELDIGYDFKQSNNNLAFGGTEVSATSTDIHQLILGQSLQLPDDYGVTSGNLSVYLSPGHLGSGNTSQAYATQRVNANARYLYARMTIDRLTKLPWDMAWDLRVQGQLATGNLLPSEQLAAAGSYGVRGYDAGSANGDAGVIINNELRSWPFALIGKSIADQAQIVLFSDYGYVLSRHRDLGEPGRINIASVGAGLRYTIDPNLIFKLDYGWQLNRLPTEPALGQFGHLYLSASF